MKNRIILIIISVLIIIAVIISVDNSKKTSSEKVEVGVLMPFTTNFAWWGDAIRNSIKLAQIDGYAKNFEFVYQDTKCDPKEAVSATQSMLALHPSMKFFIVGCDSDLKAMSSLLDGKKDLGFMVGLSGSDLYETRFPIINLAYRLETEADTAAKFASEKLGVKKLGIITDNSNFGGVLADSATKYMQSVGGVAVSERIKYNEADPSTSVLKILQSNPDAIYIQNDIPAVSTILKRLNQMGYLGKRILYYGGRDQSLIDTAGAAAEGVYVPWAISEASSTQRESFEKEFKLTFGKDPFITAYFMYDGILMLDKANKDCGDDARCIENYFYKTNNFIGTLGNVKYQPNGQVERTFYLQQIKNGKFVDVK